MQNIHRHSISILLYALLLAVTIPAIAAKPKAPTRASLEQILKHAPGDMSTRCQLIEMLLQQGDTVAAEAQITLADKLQINACVQIQKARIAHARGRYAEAASAYAKAFTLEAFPQEEIAAYRTDSLTRGAIDTRLKVAAMHDKANTFAPVGRAELAFYRGDTAEGIGFLRQALQRGDTLLRERIDSLSRMIQQDTTDTGTLLYTIPFERKNGVPTLSVTINGLKMKAEIDTTATRCTISGVESNFMLKNDYITSSMVKDSHIVLLPAIQVTDSIVLRDLRLYNDNTQTSPLVLNLAAFAQFGVARMNPSKNQIEIYERK